MEEIEKDYMLITGATGYVGKQLFIKLVANGYSVVCLGGCPKEFKGQSKQVKWRLGDEVKIPSSVREKL